MRYQRVLKLPCDDIRSGIGFKATLDLALKQLVESLFKAADGFKIEFGDHTGGHLRAVISRGVQTIEVEGCYGQNSSFTDGKKVQFVSYTVRAETGSEKARGTDNTSENTEVIGKIAGVVLSVALSCAIMSPLLRKSGKFILLLPLFAALVYGGKILGAKAARILAGGTGASGSSGGDSGQSDAVWKRLIYAIESVTNSYPTA